MSLKRRRVLSGAESTDKEYFASCSFYVHNTDAKKDTDSLPDAFFDAIIKSSETGKHKEQLNGVRRLQRVEKGFEWEQERVQVRPHWHGPYFSFDLRYPAPDIACFTKHEWEKAAHKIACLPIFLKKMVTKSCWPMVLCATTIKKFYYGV